MSSKRKKQTIQFSAQDEEIRQLQQLCEEFDGSATHTFSSFPLTERTKKGLQEKKFINPTEIQKEAILPALNGADILGAAKTGSGKTLAFLIPMLEKLYKMKWSRFDGLGALIISPTRELATQTFLVLKSFGKYHDFSAALVIGGKDIKFEERRLTMSNIIICTPGRILHHLETNHGCFTTDNLLMLVLDEADQILDQGFQQDVDYILSYLPSERQTLLFSATQTKSVEQLARVSLRDPVYVSVHEHSEHSTPEQLRQSYIVCELENKINLLWSFIKHHCKDKILVFMASCKQVKFFYQAFHCLNPRLSLLHLSSKMSQTKRLETYNSFFNRERGILFATDVAARGLDFPSVNWIFQLDCPPDANSYIHRVGRTARHEQSGESVLILLPSEEEVMIKYLEKKRIPISKIKVNQKKLFSIHTKLASFLSRDIELKDCAKRAFVAYVKSVFLMKDKTLFDIKMLDKEAFARSLGLIQAPRIRFLKNAVKNEQTIRNENDKDDYFDEENQDDDDDDNTLESMIASRPEYPIGGAEESDDEIFSVKKEISPSVQQILSIKEDAAATHSRSVKLKVLTKAALAKKLLRKKLKINTKKVFTDNDESSSVNQEPRIQLGDELCGINIDVSRSLLLEQDRIDKELERKRIKEAHKIKRLKEKEKRRADNEGINLWNRKRTGVELKTYNDEDVTDDNTEAGSEEEEDLSGCVAKKQKIIHEEKFKTSLKDEEELALRLLTGDTNN